MKKRRKNKKKYFSAQEGIVGNYVDINNFGAQEGVVGNYVDI